MAELRSEPPYLIPVSYDKEPTRSYGGAMIKGALTVITEHGSEGLRTLNVASLCVIPPIN